MKMFSCTNHAEEEVIMKVFFMFKTGKETPLTIAKPSSKSMF